MDGGIQWLEAFNGWGIQWMEAFNVELANIDIPIAGTS